MADKIIKEIEIKSPSIREMKREIKDLKDEFAQATDPEQMQRLADEISKVENNLAKTNIQIELMSHNGGALGQMKVQMSAIGKSIKQLDFDRANSQIKQLSQISFKGIISSVKQLGQVFINLGRALLTNPIFLLAAVVIGVIVALKKLMDRLGVTQKIFDALGKAVEWVKDAVVNLMKWFDKMMDNKFVRIGMALLTGGMSEIGRAINKATLNVIEQEKAYENLRIEQDKLNQSNNALITEQQRKIELMEAEGANIEDIRDAQIELAETELEATRNNILLQAELIELAIASGKSKDEIKELGDALDLLNEKEEQLAHNLKVINAKINRERTDEAKKTDEEDAKNKEKARKEEEKARKDAYDKWLKSEEKRIQDQIKFNEDRLNAARQIEDVKLELMEDGIDKELELNRIKYKRLIEDTLSNENLSNDEKAKLIELFKEQQKINDEKLKQDNLDETIRSEYEKEARIKKLKLDLKKEQADDEIETAKQLAEDQFNLDLEALKYKLDQELMTEEEYDLEKQILEAKHLKVMTDLDNEATEIKKKNEEELAKLREEKQQNALNNIATGINAVNGMMSALFQNEINMAEGNEKKQEEIRKRQFKAEKALNLVNAAIATALAILKGAPNPVAMALAGATGAASIATIVSQKYTGSNSSVSTPDVSSISSNAQRNVPNINFTGTGTNRSEVVASPNINNNVDVQTQVVISEYEITSTQNKVKQLKDNATI